MPAGIETGKIALTPRELEILRMLCRGRCRKEIAWDMHMSKSNVNLCVCALYAKIGARGMVQAAVWAAKHGLV